MKRKRGVHYFPLEQEIPGRYETGLFAAGSWYGTCGIVESNEENVYYY